MSSEQGPESGSLILSGSGSTSSTPRTASRYTTKRPHRKSRAGCTLCKQRKIKCDEQHPQCTACKKRNSRCSFAPAPAPEPEPEPQQAVIGSPSNSLMSTNGLNFTDLHLMHHFATSTAKSLAVNRPGMEELLRNDIPRLAFQHDFLMHCILGISSLHLDHISPSKSSPFTSRKFIVGHHVSAISGFRRAIASLSSSNAEPVLLSSLFLLIIGARDSSFHGDGEQWITSWLGLHTGIRAIIDSIHWDAVQTLSIAPVFSRGNESAILPVKLPLGLWQLFRSWDMRQPDNQILMRSLFALGVLYSLFADEGPSSSEFFLKVSSWPASLPMEYSQMARQMRPEALVILAYYFALSKVATAPVWWLQGVSDRGIGAIALVLRGRLSHLMQFPMEIVAVTDPERMADLLVSQLAKETTPQKESGVPWDTPLSPPNITFDMFRPPSRKPGTE